MGVAACLQREGRAVGQPIPQSTPIPPPHPTPQNTNCNPVQALYDGQYVDAHFTRSFYKHMLGQVGGWGWVGTAGGGRGAAGGAHTPLYREGILGPAVGSASTSTCSARWVRLGVVVWVWLGTGVTRRRRPGPTCLPSATPHSPYPAATDVRGHRGGGSRLLQEPQVGRRPLHLM